MRVNSLCHPWPVYIWEKIKTSQCIGGRVIPTASLDVTKRKIFVPYGIQTPNSSHPAHTLVTVLID